MDTKTLDMQAELLRRDLEAHLAAHAADEAAKLSPLHADAAVERGMTRDAEPAGPSPWPSPPLLHEPEAPTVLVPPLLATIVGALGISNVVTLIGLVLLVVAVGGLFGGWVALLVLAIAVIAIGYVLHLYEARVEQAKPTG